MTVVCTLDGYLARIVAVGREPLAGEFELEIPAGYPYRHAIGDGIPFTSYGSFDPCKATRNVAIIVSTEGT